VSDYTGHAEYRALIAAVCAAPDDDLPRLVLADWLDEHGESERSEFIRVQVEIAKGPPAPQPDESLGEAFAVMGKWSRREDQLRRREWELWESVRLTFGLPADVYPILKGWDSRAHDSLAFASRGFVSEWHGPLAVWCGGECEGCGPAVRGGMGHRSPDCPACHGTGRIVGIGPELVRSQPVERVVLTDREPHPNSYVGSTVCGWQAETGDPVMFRGRSHIPYSLLRVMAETDGDDLDGRTWITFPTRQHALDALSAAAIAWAKSQNKTSEPVTPVTVEWNEDEYVAAEAVRRLTTD